MNDYAIVTLSHYKDIFGQFQRSVSRFAPANVRKILVRDVGELKEEDFVVAPDGWLTITGPSPFGFSANGNLGIKAAGDLDVILANDDTEILGPGDLDRLREIAYSSDEIGLLSPQIAGAALNPYQHAGRKLPAEPYIPKQSIAFVFIYLKRSTINRVGLLDSDTFKMPSFEDNDYCLRTLAAGLKLAITSQVVVKHGFGGVNGSAAIKRKYGGYRPLIKENRTKFQRKWRKQ